MSAERNTSRPESEDDSGDESSPEISNDIPTAYSQLSSRRVDLIGDYAGNELFLIEGDSLLLECFSDPKLDYENGFQMLHACYLVENYLRHLKERKCNYHIAFFADHESISTPPWYPNRDSTKYKLTRAAIIRHLKVNLATAFPEIKVSVFPSMHDTAFTDYLHNSGMYFIMAHDAAIPMHDVDKTALKQQDVKHHQTVLRKMIITFIKHGYNVALINGLEWRDTKVMTMVLEGSRKFQAVDLDDDDDVSEASKQSVEVPELGKLGDSLANLSERERLTVITISRTDNKSSANILYHTALLSALPISSRRLNDVQPAEAADLSTFISTANELLKSDEWSSFHDQNSTICDVADLIDGRLLNAVMVSGVPDASTLPDVLRSKYEALCKSVELLSGRQVHGIQSDDCSSETSVAISANGEHASASVLPFSNPVFDKHLESIHLSIDDDVEEGTPASARIFREVSHWHNAKRPIVPKAAPTVTNKREETWIAKRNQWFMAEMTTYAASLTNAIGKSLEPETIVIGGKQITAAPSTESNSHSGKKAPKNENVKDDKKKDDKKKGGKKPGKGAGKAAIMESIAAQMAKKDEASDQKSVQAWHVIVKNLSAERELPARYSKAKEYQTNLSDEKRKLFGAEVGLYMLSTLLEYWIRVARVKERDHGLGLAALIWHLVKTIPSQGNLTKTIVVQLELTKKTLGLPLVLPEAPASDRALPFKFALPATTADSLAIKLSSKDFQLLHCGPYLDRSIDSAPDARVEFEPDGWQRKVLDGIDANKSLFVVAPTSAGKTFISFYAMRKVLEADDDSVLVYVAPTKALVNQIAAEIQARYSKKFKYGGKSVWAIHTRDYRINNPTGCQVLVTVPHVLQIMLLAPSHANSWSNKVKRIIFDEVHSIGNADDGVVWEQLLLLAPCPIIALSATVGNPQEFSGWLESTQKSMGVELESIQHHSRYSDLRKFYYNPPEKFAFNGLEEGRVGGFGRLGLDGAPGFSFMHPVASLVNRSRGIPDDFSLEARDCLTLWQALDKNANDKYPVSKDLDPAKALPSVVRKIDVLNWEKALKEILGAWMADLESPFEAVIAELNKSFYNDNKEKLQVTKASAASAEVGQTVDQGDLLDTTLPLLCRLHEQEALPAIFFNYERGLCERICQNVVAQLADAEKAWKETSPKWKAHLKAWEDWKKVQAKKNSKIAKPSKSKVSREDGEGDRTSKSEQQRDAASADYSVFDGFDPEAPVEGFHFADHKKVQTSELDTYYRQLGRRNVQQWLVDAISRGVGVHHAGMNRKYRQVVEILYRKGFLRVVIATGTLALGINMPTRTVVFSGDSVFLTALNFRQCAGRAGRRGFDLLGNVVFQGVPRAKVCRLLSSRLPDLNGHFPITTTLVLRLFTLLHESKQSKYAVKAINTLLSQPRLFMGGPSFKAQTLHHLRFSIEYLRRQQLLDSSGATLNFAGLVSHLYFTENASFAFHALLKEGFFHKLCADIDNKEQSTIETLMLVMSHLFGRVYCKQADREYIETVVKPSSSLVFLPPMPEEASAVLREHSEQILGVFSAYVQTFVEQHINDADDQLPLTGMKAGGSNGEVPAGIKDKVLPPTEIRSQFYALSGHSDKFNSVADLCRTTRSGVFLEESVVPHVGLYPEDLDSPLNAYLLDFFKHGDINTLERANKIRKGDVWFLLNDFSLVLATIITSLMNFMKLKPANDLDMLEVMGNLDAVEEAEDDTTIEASETESKVDSVITDPSVKPEKPVMSKSKVKKLESWEDAADVEDVFEKKDAARKAAAEKEEMFGDAAWEGAGGERGLIKVLKAFQKLQVEFNVKFKAMWA